MATDTGLKYVKYGPYAEAIPNTGSVPSGQQEISYEDFINIANTAQNDPKGLQLKDWFDKMRQNNPQAFVKGSSSGLTMVNGVPTKISTIKENEVNEAGVAAGTMKKVPVGGGFGYVPIGSAGDANLKNIGTQNTANQLNAGVVPGVSQGTPTPSAPTLLKQGTGSSTAPNAEVQAIQKQLGITADGIFGPQTKSAVMAFQQSNGLVVDGIVGPLTRAALAKGGGGQTGGAPSTSGTPTTPGATPTAPIQITPQTEIATMNADSQKMADAMLASFQKTVGTSVEVSNSDKLIKALTESFENKLTEEKPKTLVEQLATKRAELGVDPLENDINSIDAEIAKLDSDFLALQEKTGNRRVSLGQINRRKSAEEMQYTQMKNELTLQKNALANQLNQKYSVLNTYMQYTGMDYQNAQNEYNTKFSQAISMINLVKNVEETAKSDAEKVVDNARANAQLMIDALKGSNTNFDTLNPTTQAEIQKLELQANLPSGFVKFAMGAVDEPVVSIGSSFDNASGQRMTPIYTKDPSTGVVSVKMISLGAVDAGSPSDDEEDKKAGLEADVQQAITYMVQSKEENDWRGFNPDEYAAYRQQIFKEYGAVGVTRLDQAIKQKKFKVDYGAASDVDFRDEDEDVFK